MPPRPLRSSCGGCPPVTLQSWPAYRRYAHTAMTMCSSTMVLCFHRDDALACCNSKHVLFRRQTVCVPLLLRGSTNPSMEPTNGGLASQHARASCRPSCPFHKVFERSPSCLSCCRPFQAASTLVLARGSCGEMLRVTGAELAGRMHRKSGSPRAEEGHIQCSGRGAQTMERLRV